MSKARKPRKCELCHEEEAVYALQYIASDEPSFYTLGEHIRGFRVTRVGSACAWKIREGFINDKEEGK